MSLPIEQASTGVLLQMRRAEMRLIRQPAECRAAAWSRHHAVDHCIINHFIGASIIYVSIASLITSSRAHLQRRGGEGDSPPDLFT